MFVKLLRLGPGARGGGVVEVRVGVGTGVLCGRCGLAGLDDQRIFGRVVVVADACDHRGLGDLLDVGIGSDLGVEDLAQDSQPNPERRAHREPQREAELLVRRGRCGRRSCGPDGADVDRGRLVAARLLQRGHLGSQAVGSRVGDVAGHLRVRVTDRDVDEHGVERGVSCDRLGHRVRRGGQAEVLDDGGSVRAG